MAELSPAANRVILQVNQGERHEKADQLAVEFPLTLDLNGNEFVTLLCTPQEVEDLAVGFLYSEGLIDRIEDVACTKFSEAEQRVTVTTSRPVSVAEKLFGKRTVTTGCGRGTIFYHVSDALKSRPVQSDARIDGEAITDMMRHWEERTPLFQSTGCPHSAALGSVEGEILAVREDIGRHNAVDKIVGWSLRERRRLSDKIMLTTGRISSEMLIKVARAGIPLVASRSAPTELAVSFGEALGITLIGFVRGRRFNVYTHFGRVR